MLIKAQKAGTLDATKSPDILAEHLLNFWNGVNVTQIMYPEDKKIRTIIESNLQILNTGEVKYIDFSYSN